jgi:photosystem II stability/assembly factor-like uncharacterized protein
MVNGVLVAALGMVSLGVQGQWKDPLETPSISTLKAHENLLLDITLTGDRLVAVGERGHIIYSDDDGYTWRQGSVPAMTTLTSVYFVNNNIGWTVGHDAVVLKTTNAGLSWVKQFDGFRANEMVLAQAKANKSNLESELAKAKVMGNPSRISDAEEQLENATFALEDAQYDFEDRSTKPLLDVWFKNENEGFVVGAYGMIFKTTDGGETWSDWSGRVENPDRFHINSITSIDGDRLMMVGEAGLLLRTSNGGNSWEKMFSPYEGSFFGVQSLTSQGVQIAYGLRGNLARTDNFGSNWRLVDTGTTQTLLGGTDRRGRVSFVVGNGGAFLKGFDFARKWEASTRTGRSSAAGIVESNGGHFVAVGENGIELLNKYGERLPEAVKSIGDK